MTETERQVAIAALHATIASAETALVALGAMTTDDTAQTDGGCTHPLELRQDMTTMGGPVEWRCRACDFHSVTPD